jgi:hypothetical protein
LPNEQTTFIFYLIIQNNVYINVWLCWSYG